MLVCMWGGVHAWGECVPTCVAMHTWHLDNKVKKRSTRMRFEPMSAEHHSITITTQPPCHALVVQFNILLVVACFLGDMT